MKLWKVPWGYGDLVTMAETKEEAKEKFLKYNPDCFDRFDEPFEVINEVEYFGE